MKNAGFWVAALVGIAIDRFTKLWVANTMELGQSLPAIPGLFRFTYIENTGAAWSLFRESGGFLKWISLVVALVLVAMALFGQPMRRWEQLGYGCILAGAIGNGVDRFMSGAVVDFLDFVPIDFPIFNVADVAINIGVACLIVGTFASAKPERE
ncbi:signal peptidase II [Synechococcus sp. PCC 7336]|uniref:signal peptidase II n=1 Tax=Synechococcus sp. PCC 7336 TaxID=195250 RepID=UPI00034711C7|nr:signal peptidase II [Synechococcus sp. PCC 7336]